MKHLKLFEELSPYTELLIFGDPYIELGEEWKNKIIQYLGLNNHPDLIQDNDDYQRNYLYWATPETEWDEQNKHFNNIETQYGIVIIGGFKNAICIVRKELGFYDKVKEEYLNVSLENYFNRNRKLIDKAIKKQESL